MSDILTEFRGVTQQFKADHIEYAVCGGWAVAIHGAARATIDIDVLILADDLARAWQLAENLGYNMEGVPLSFANGVIEIRGISKIGKASGALFTIDFLLVTDALRKVWDTREDFEWEGGNVSTVSREGLIAMKLLSGRHQDLADIESLSSNEN